MGAPFPPPSPQPPPPPSKFTTGGQMTFASCETYCAALGSEVACVTSDADQAELASLSSGSCYEFWLVSAARPRDPPLSPISLPSLLSPTDASLLSRAPCAGLQRLGWRRDLVLAAGLLLDARVRRVRRCGVQGVLREGRRSGNLRSRQRGGTGVPRRRSRPLCIHAGVLRPLQRA